MGLNKLKVYELSHTKDWANTATRQLREFMLKYNALVDRVEHLEKEVIELRNNPTSRPEGK